jgi:hypothetical protein
VKWKRVRKSQKVCLHDIIEGHHPHTRVWCFAEALAAILELHRGRSSCAENTNFTPHQGWFTSERKCEAVKEGENSVNW